MGTTVIYVSGMFSHRGRFRLAEITNKEATILLQKGASLHQVVLPRTMRNSNVLEPKLTLRPPARGQVSPD